MEELRLKKIRKNIDTIDKKILALLNKRLDYIIEVAKIKKVLSKNIRIKKREEEIYTNLISINDGLLSDIALRDIWKKIILESVKLEKNFLKKN